MRMNDGEYITMVHVFPTRVFSCTLHATKIRQFFFQAQKHSHVDLGKHRLVLPNLLGQLLVHRRHHPAGTAPIRVKVDNDGQTGLPRVLLEQSIEFVGGANVSHQRPGRHQACKEG